MDLDLIDKQVVVVGGTKGIGLAIAKSFISEGSIVHVISRHSAFEVEGYFSSIKNSKIFFYQGDVLDESSLESVAGLILKRTNNIIDIVVSNVGSGAGVLDAIPNDNEWNQSWAINFNSSLNTVRIFSKYFRENKGSILFIASIAGLEYIGAPISYSTAKAALISFSKSLSHKLAPKIRVNTISPGNIFFKGGTWEEKNNNNPEMVSKILNEKVPVKRFGTAEEVGNLAIFLSSNKASFITGSCFVIDGGQTISF